jgi:Fic family protein
LFWVKNPDTGKKVKITSGEFRNGDVVIGRNIPPLAKSIPVFLKRFEEAYNFNKLSRINQIIAVAAAHHRLLWIHPFYDGNGRVTRLLSHAAFLKTGAGNRLWSISRGLARNSSDYKKKLEQADEPRQGDLDGRGSL